MTNMMTLDCHTDSASLQGESERFSVVHALVQEGTLDRVLNVHENNRAHGTGCGPDTSRQVIYETISEIG